MKTLQQWYNEGQINYADKQALNKMGVSDYDYHNLQDLKQMDLCGYWAKLSSNIKDEITNPIRKITFFTPSFNDSKPDASNYSCALVEDSNYQDWAISYRPSYVDSISSDAVVKKIYDVNEVENSLNSGFPILAVAPSYGSFNDFVTWPYVTVKDLPSDGKYNPDKYILPLDVVKTVGRNIDHYAVYLGSGQVCNYNWSGSKFYTWQELMGAGSSNSLAELFNSTGSSGASGKVVVHHPRIPFKCKEEIIRHLSKAVKSKYGKKTLDNYLLLYVNSIIPTEKRNYNWSVRNCEHFANRIVLGINISAQVDSSRNFNLRDEVWDSGTSSQAPDFDDLTSSDCSYEKNQINNYIQQAESNRNYTRSRTQIEQEKFTARIEVRPNPPCKIQ